MPNYLFKNPKTGQIVEVFQKAADEHVHSEKGVVFERVWTVPQASFDTQIDPFSSQAFVEKTSNGKQKLGDLWDRSAEMSEKRKSKMGRDPIKEKWKKDYKADRDQK